MRDESLLQAEIISDALQLFSAIITSSVKPNSILLIAGNIQTFSEIFYNNVSLITTYIFVLYIIPVRPDSSFVTAKLFLDFLPNYSKIIAVKRELFIQDILYRESNKK